MLMDVTPLGLGGKQAEEALGACGITVNKNMIPYRRTQADGPLGHADRHAGADHARHGAREMKAIAGWIIQALKAPGDQALHGRLRADVFDLCEQFSVPAASLEYGEE